MPGRFRDKKLWIGLGISLFFLFLLFRKIDFDKLLGAFREMDYRYLWPAVLFTFISYFFRAIRWRFLLLPLKKTRLGNLFPATIIGYMMNNILPARIGEFVRAYVLAEKEGLSKSAVFATLVVDRLFDGFTILLILLFTFFTVKLPLGMEGVQHSLVAGGYVSLALYFSVIIFLIVLRKRTDGTIRLIGKLLRPFPSKVAEKIIPLLGSFIGGLRLTSNTTELMALVFTSLLIWAFAIWPVDLVLHSFGISLPITASMFIMVFLVFAVMVPASPGYVGTYHAACVYGLMAFNIQKEKALSVALIIHGVNFFPVILAGAYYLWRDNVSLRAIKERSMPDEAD
ncbi:MAG TPA: lysylphosphatidylglycerol synthase transmembrane domain-containing protein [Geobacteraceae bacterium]|nr:lysylphosphatidylglycerol synthase transmembrane domain-containing protein [Geobacteraceae bacterium]